MLQNYTVESIKNVIPYELSVNIRDIDVYMSVKMDTQTFEIYFQKIYDYHLFCYLVKRANDFGVISPNSEFEILGLKQYVALDNELKLVVSTDTKEFDKGGFNKKIKTFVNTGEHAFWGNYKDEEIFIKIGNKYVNKEFSKVADLIYKTKIIVQPEEFDTSYIVYTDQEFKPKEPLRLVFNFKKNKDCFVFIGVVKSDWIY